MADRVAFSKGWAQFAVKSQMAVNDTVIFIPMDGGFDFRFYRKGISMEVIWGCKKHRSGP
jgi:hypothetical protein